MTLEKTPYTSPDLEEERQNKNRLLDEALRVDAVQFGVFFRYQLLNAVFFMFFICIVQVLLL